jgi:hypothetical protein
MDTEAALTQDQGRLIYEVGALAKDDMLLEVTCMAHATPLSAGTTSLNRNRPTQLNLARSWQCQDTRSL